MNFLFTCCPKIYGCLLTLSSSLCYRGALPNFLHASTPLLLGLSDRNTGKSPRTCIPAWSFLDHQIYCMCIVPSKHLLHWASQGTDTTHTEISEPCIHSHFSNAFSSAFYHILHTQKRVIFSSSLS